LTPSATHSWRNGARPFPTTNIRLAEAERRKAVPYDNIRFAKAERRKAVPYGQHPLC